MQENITSFLQHQHQVGIEHVCLRDLLVGDTPSTRDCHGGDVNLTNPSPPTSPTALQPQCHSRFLRRRINLGEILNILITITGSRYSFVIFAQEIFLYLQTQPIRQTVYSNYNRPNQPLEHGSGFRHNQLISTLCCYKPTIMTQKKNIEVSSKNP